MKTDGGENNSRSMDYVSRKDDENHTNKSSLTSPLPSPLKKMMTIRELHKWLQEDGYTKHYVDEHIEIAYASYRHGYYEWAGVIHRDNV